jgi:alanine-glyoxylate transaminase / (R)-3-amino-2-methylpropionate-pyruvate transaminase
VNHREIGEIRWLMLGVELVKDRTTKEPVAEFAKEVMERAKERGLLIGRGGLYGNVLSIKPPLCITKADAEFMLQCFDECI